MKRKKLLLFGLVFTLLIGSTISVHATEIALTDGLQTATTPSTFNVTDDLVVDGAVVRIPATLDAEYNENYGTFFSEGEVAAYGEILETSQVIVSCPRELTYTNTATEDTVKGYVNFGDIKNEICTSMWNATDVAEGQADNSLADTRSLIVNIPATGLPSIGDYEASVEFDITLGFMGLYSEICAPTTSGYKDGFRLSNTITSESINLTNDTSFFHPTAYSNSNLKYLQMGEEVEYYASNVNLDTCVLSSWIKDYSNLQVLVIPKNLTITQLKNNCSSTYDYSSTVFTNTNTIVGDALVFAKGQDAEMRFIYVPHIVYRGTMDEWRALSGNTDWVFGNAANVVTVHCYDGNIIY